MGVGQVLGVRSTPLLLEIRGNLRPKLIPNLSANRTAQIAKMHGVLITWHFATCRVELYTFQLIVLELDLRSCVCC